jgi:ribosomal protein L7/L12
MNNITSSKLKAPVNLLSINEDWLELQQEFKNSLPKDGTRFPKQEDLMKAVSKWYQSQIPGFGLGAAGGPAVQEKKAEKAEQKKEEVQEVAKEVYDIELVSFDAGKKIGLIKEVRGLTSLGLKEAKELVEKAPTVIMKGVKRADCDAVLKKMAENGAVAKLK